MSNEHSRTAANPVATGLQPARDSGLDDWITPARFGLFLAALIFISFPQVLLGMETFFIRDYGLFSFPNAAYQRECFWQGELPFWNPYNYCGVPFLAQWNTMPLYPLSLIYLLPPLGWSLSFFCLLHLQIAGMGMFFLVRRWTGNPLAGAVAGLAFAFNGLSLNLLIWPSHEATYAWMPWVVLAAERAWQEGKLRVVLAGLAGATQMLAGAPETILFTWTLVFVLWGVAVATRRTSLKSGLRLIVVTLLVAALAAPQILPFMELARHSQRGLDEDSGFWPLPARGWANFLVPMAFGNIWKEGIFFQNGQSWTSSYYFGIGIVLLVLWAAWKIRDPRVWCLLLVICAAFLLGLGDQTVAGRWLRQQFPALTLSRYAVKYVFVIVFASTLLAGIAVAHWRKALLENKQTHSRDFLWPALVIAVLIGAILAWAVAFPRPNEATAAAVRNGLMRVGFLLAIVVVLWLLGKNREPRWQQLFSAALLCLLWFDVGTHAPRQNPTAPPAIYTPGIVQDQLDPKPVPELGKSRVMTSPAAYAFLSTNHIAEPNTFLAARLACFCNVNLLDHTPALYGFSSLMPLESAGLTGLFYAFSDMDLSRLQDFLAISQIAAPDKAPTWQARTSFLPVVTAGQRPVFLGDTNAVRLMMRPDFDPSRVLFLPPETQPLVSVDHQTAARIVSQVFGRQRIELEIEAGETSLVTIAQTYYHCWRAYVDDHPAPLWRANYAFQTVQVPPGTHRVRLVYEDRAFRFGMACFGLALLACGVFGLRIWRQARAGELVAEAGKPEIVSPRSAP